MLSLAIFGLVVVAVGTGWYACFRLENRKRSLRALHWIECAFEGHGKIVGVNWIGPSRFQVHLRLGPNPFQHASILVQLLPREFPHEWFKAIIDKRQELLTFESDLEIPPEVNLEVENHRWCGRTRRRMPKSQDGWIIERSQPFMITSNACWQEEMTMMNALIASREREFTNIRFQKESPHFTATLPLEAIAPGDPGASELFDILRELAGGASASRL